MKFFCLIPLILGNLYAVQSVQMKKQHFFNLLVPPVKSVYAELNEEFLRVKSDINSSHNLQKIETLKKIYKVESNQELLMALKPHPPSIVLAQAAMESAWATSRFFVKANNVFGMWSSNKKENRIAAKEKRNGKRTIWLKKFSTIKASIKAYYKTLARAKEYKKFRKYRYASKDVYKIIKGLDKYSEMGQEYVKSLKSVIKHNKLQKYD